MGSRGSRGTFGAKRRAQRGFTKRAGWAVGRTSQSGAVRRAGYNTRRLGLRPYRNKLWETTRFKTHWRSTFAVVGNLTSPVSTIAKSVIYFTAWGGNTAGGGSVGNFWTAAGGLQELGLNTGFGEFNDLTIRGGRFNRRYTNIGDATVRLERWELYRKPQVPTTPAEVFEFDRGLGWDPTYEPDFQDKWRVGRKFINDIEPGDTFTIENKIPIAKIDQDIWNGGGQRPWMVTAVSSATSNETVTIQSWHSVSFSGDRVGVDV